MSKINIEIWGMAVICNDEDCPNRRECTNHQSAGDFRSDAGLRPELAGIDVVNEVAWCSTRDAVIEEDSFEYGSMVTLDEVGSQLALDL